MHAIDRHAPVWRSAHDLLDLADALDAEWHGDDLDQSRAPMARWWAQLMSPARGISAALPRRTLRDAVALRGMRAVDDSIGEQGDEWGQAGSSHILLRAGSPLGHRQGQAAWVVQVVPLVDGEVKGAFRALQRVRILRRIVQRRFDVPALAVLVVPGDSREVPVRFDQQTLVLGREELGPAVEVSSTWDLPGAAWDRTLCKLGLLRALAADEPLVPGAAFDPYVLARRAEGLGWAIRRPVAQGMAFDDAPTPLAEWLAMHAETPQDLRVRVRADLEALQDAGLVTGGPASPRLTWAGGDLVLWMLRHLDRG